MAKRLLVEAPSLTDEQDKAFREAVLTGKARVSRRRFMALLGLTPAMAMAQTWQPLGASSGAPLTWQKLETENCAPGTWCKLGVPPIFKATITTHQKELNLAAWAAANGWDGSLAAEITIAPGVYIWSDNTAVAGLTTGVFPGGLTIINQGYIIGKGGAGAFSPSTKTPVNGQPGGPALALSGPTTIDNTYPAAYIAGGGGGGGACGYGGGGGGAGGGAGGGTGIAGGSIGQVGATPPRPGQVNATTLGGGGGGRILPGKDVYSLYVDEYLEFSFTFGGEGGGSGSLHFYSAYMVGQGGTGSGGNRIGGDAIRLNKPGYESRNHANTTDAQFGGGGGGGWGAAGGKMGPNPYFGTTGYGGAGGNAVKLNGYAVTFVNNDTARVWGAVS